MVVLIHLFVKIFKKLMCHIVIGGCKVGVLHRLLIEFILPYTGLSDIIHTQSASPNSININISLSDISGLEGVKLSFTPAPY